MSWWTQLRDGVETAAALVANYYLPGSGIIGSFLNSKGSQEQLGSTLGQLAMLGTGISGASGMFNADGVSNMANYGKMMDSISSGVGEMFSGTPTGTGVSGIGTIQPGIAQGIAIEPDAFGMPGMASQQGSTMLQAGIESGQTPMQALQASGMSPSQAQAAGIQPGNGQTWMDVATQNNIPYSGGAAPVFSGQQLPGAAGAPGGGTMGSPSGGMMGVPGAGGGTAFGQTAGASGGAPFAGASPQGATGGIQGQGWGSPNTLMSMGSGLYGLAQSNQMSQMAQRAAAAADPFAQYRGQYAQQLQQLTSNPSSMMNMPGYQAGIQAVQRAMNAQGFGGSGNMATALQKYGGDFYNQQVNQLSGLAGAGFNPAAAQQIGMAGQGAAVGLAGQSLASLGYGARQATGGTAPGQYGYNPYAWPGQSGNPAGGGATSTWGV